MKVYSGITEDQLKDLIHKAYTDGIQDRTMAQLNNTYVTSGQMTEYCAKALVEFTEETPYTETFIY